MYFSRWDVFILLDSVDCTLDVEDRCLKMSI